MKTLVKTTILKVNLQDGFLLDDNMYPVAAFNLHNSSLYVRIPLRSHDIEIPESLSTLTVIDGHTDSFGINMWTNNGRVDI